MITKLEKKTDTRSLNINTVKKLNVDRAKKIIFDNWQLYILLLPALAVLAVFMYAPMYGVLIAFKHYNAKLGIMGSEWAGLTYFKQFFSTNIASRVIRNTIVLSLQQLAISFPIPIIFALSLNQLNSKKFKKVVQTVSYAPYFVSNVVVVSIMAVILAPGGGFVNVLIQNLGSEPKLFMSQPEYFRPLYIISGIWQTMGFSAIVYIAALAGISPEYYEAAIVDGASKIKRIIYIDLPLITPTIAIMFILAIGNLMSIGYEKVFLMQNGMNLQVSEIISTYVYKSGLMNAQYSFATAVGLFNSTVNLILLIVANTFAKRVSDITLF
jgi:putative aldouronate transport system permease protein